MSYIFIGYSNNAFSRSKNYYNSLRKMGYNAKWVEIQPGFPGLYSCIRQREVLRRAQDIIVTSPSNLVVIYILIATLRRPLYDAGWPVSDGIFSRKRHSLGFLSTLSIFKQYVVDLLCFFVSKKVFLETAEQIARVRKWFFCPQSKLELLYTGFDENRYAHRLVIQNTNNVGCYPIRVLFRGGKQPESGLNLFIETARILEEDRRFSFQIIGVPQESRPMLTNLKYFGRDIPDSTLLELISNCSVMIGQMSEESRLDWTIPNRFYEAAFFKKPYFAVQKGPMSAFKSIGIVTTIPFASPKALGDLLIDFSYNIMFYDAVAVRLHEWFETYASSRVLGLKLLGHLNK